MYTCTFAFILLAVENRVNSIIYHDVILLSEIFEKIGWRRIQCAFAFKYVNN